MRFINSCVYNGYFYFLPSAQSHAFKALTSILLEFDNPHCWEKPGSLYRILREPMAKSETVPFLIWVHLSLYTFLLAPHFAISHLEYKTRMKQTNQSKENPFFIFFIILIYCLIISIHRAILFHYQQRSSVDTNNSQNPNKISERNIRLFLTTFIHFSFYFKGSNVPSLP